MRKQSERPVRPAPAQSVTSVIDVILQIIGIIQAFYNFIMTLLGAAA